MIAIIIAALAGAGVFAYLSLSGGSTPQAQPAPVANQILPHGTSLDFEAINKFNETGKKFPYPVVSPGEIGQTLNTIVRK